MKKLKKIIFIALFAGILFNASSSLAATLPKAAKLLPPETFILVETANFKQLSDQFEKTNLYKLYKDPSMAAFFENTRSKWKKKNQELKKNYLLKGLIESGVFPQGMVAAALVIDKEKPQDDPKLLLISKWAQNIEKIKETIDKNVSKSIDEGAIRKTEDYRGVRIMTIIKELPPLQVPDYSNFNPADGNNLPMKTIEQQPVKVHHCFINDTLIISLHLEHLKFVIAHAKGATSPTLADESDYETVIKSVGPHQDAAVYVNIKKIIETAVAADQSGTFKNAMINLGLENVSSLAVSLEVARTSGQSLSVKSLLKVNGEKLGILKMLEPKSANLSPPRHLCQDTYSTVFLNYSISKVYAELANILIKFSPEAAAYLYMPLPISDSPDEPPLRIKEDIIDHLGEQVLISQSVNKPFSKKSPPTETLLSIAISDRSSLDASLSRLHTKFILPNAPESQREFLGYTIYTIGNISLPFFKMQRQPLQDLEQKKLVDKQAFAITDTHLIIGKEKNIEQAIRTLKNTDAAPIESKKWFRVTRGVLPGAVGICWLEDGVASGEAAWWMIKETAKNLPANNMMPTNLTAMQFGNLFDPKLLPEFEAVKKYFMLTTLYGISRASTSS
jgi:hypothetical protein